jgi:tetratricopeptide (TPR) repeat protein
MSKSKVVTPQKKSQKTAGRDLISSFWMKIIFAVLILFLYGRTIGYEFVLDDGLIIENNPVVQKGAAGIFETFTQGSVTHFKGSNFQIYRPAFISLLCVENQFFGMSPAGFHLLNVVMYWLLAVLIFRLLGLLFPSLHFYYRALIAILFIVHPIHTEVVANVKSQDELLATLGCVTALYYFIRHADAGSGRVKFMVFSMLGFLLALFSKESSFAFVVIFPLSLFLFRDRSILLSLKESLYYFAAAGFFLLVRRLAISDINVPYETSAMENVLYAAKTTSELLGTKLEIAFYYLRMMVFPYPMSWDYSFNQIPVVPMAHAVPLMSVLIYSIIAFLFFWNIRRQPAVSFAIAFFVALSVPTASLFFPNGTTFADRFLFMPSLGFIIALVYIAASRLGFDLQDPSPSVKRVVLITGAVLLLPCSWLTISRAADWKDNFAVFSSGARNSPNSSRTNEGLGTMYMNKAQSGEDPSMTAQYVDSALFYLERSLKLFPDNNSASYRLGLIYSMRGESDKAVRYYRQSIQSKPDYFMALNNLGALYASRSNFDSAYYFFARSLKSEPKNDMTLTNLTVVCFNLGKYQEAVNYGEQLIALGFKSAKVYGLLAQSYGRLGNQEQAARYQALYDVNPNLK